MKKGQIYEGIVDEIKFPNKGIINKSCRVDVCPEGNGEGYENQPSEERQVTIKNVLPGQKIRFMVSKIRKGKAEGRALEVMEKSPLETDTCDCPHYGRCGGCNYRTLPYEEQLKMKASQVLELMESVVDNADEIFEGIKPSPRVNGYRNKMEFTFGDEIKDGPMTLGMHKRGGFYDIVTVDHCQIVDEDYRRILSATVNYFSEKEVPFFHRMRHTGYLRHLIVRKAVKTGEILVDLVTTTQNPFEKPDPTEFLSVDQIDFLHHRERPEEELRKEAELLQGWADQLCALSLEGTFAGILHTKNDSVADAVKNEGTELLYGQDCFYEELLGLRFRISPFSFFQTNSLGAEVLYDTARGYIRDSLKESGADLEGKVVFDLYSGTGTIAQMLASVSGSVVGVEIVEEAVRAAEANAALNGLDNCRFIAGDVLKVLDDIEEKPDFIVLDPPRDGIHPKALEKIIHYGVQNMIYISCKPTSLQRDLEVLQARGYEVKRICCCDMFPATSGIETIAMLAKK